MTTAPTELKPCPFCGHQPLSIDKWIGKHLGWQIFCHHCDASVAVEGLTEAEAIAAWNTRAPAAPITDEQVEAAARAIERARTSGYGWTEEQFEVWWTRDRRFSVFEREEIYRQARAALQAAKEPSHG